MLTAWHLTLGELFINPSYTLAHYSFTQLHTHTPMKQAHRVALAETPAHPSADTFLPERLN